MPGILFVALLGLALAGAQEELNTFPYCPCQTASAYPPYTWSLTSTSTPEPGATRFCYAIKTTKYEGDIDYSCVNYDLRKIEIDTVPECSGYIKDLTFDGEALARSTQRFGNPVYGVVTKFTRGGGRDLGTVDDMAGRTVEACYTLFGQCNTEAKFCKGGVCQVAFFDKGNNCCPKEQFPPPPPPPTLSPSPSPSPPPPPPPKSPSPSPPPPPKSPSPSPPPPPKSPSPSPPPPPKSPSPSPPPPPPPVTILRPPSPPPPPPPTSIETDGWYCPCNYTNPGPYSLTRDSTMEVSGGTRYCFTLTATPVDGSYACASFDLRKIEFDISLNCRGAAKDLTYNGQKLAASFQAFPAPLNGMVFKVGRPQSDKNPVTTEADLIGKEASICFTLYDGECGNLDSFCRNGVCRVAFFNPDNKCCPIIKA